MIYVISINVINIWISTTAIAIAFTAAADDIHLLIKYSNTLPLPRSIYFTVFLKTTSHNVLFILFNATSTQQTSTQT